MPASVLYMSMSLDGYITGPDDGPGNPGGDRFMRLHEWFVTPDGESFRPSGPAGELNYPLVTYVSDGIASAMAQAKAAAGDLNVMVHGAYTAQRALEAGVLDELQIH